ncbi:MAG: DnaA/Hda family protein [Paracoccaceae bacterium]
MDEQLSFSLPAKPALGRSDFFVSPANAIAVAMIDSWPDWPGRKLTLCGPEGSGKSHLVHVWAAMTDAQIVSAANLEHEEIPALSGGPVAVEDIPEIAQNVGAQTALFHLHNLLLAEGHSLLLTGISSPDHWDLSLPDLQSRMQGSQYAELQPPDDALLTAILTKLFADRQINPPLDLIPYLVTRMDRSFAAACNLVEQLDHQSLAQHRKLNRALARDLLGAI